MIVRFGYVAMSVIVKNASPSKTMTATSFKKIEDREAAIRKLERIAEENLQNTLRLLYHNRAHDISLYRFSSKLIPLIGHEMLKGWDPFPFLNEKFKEVGDYVKLHKMRVSFHPDHFTVLSTPRAEVLKNSILDLQKHLSMLEAMGLDERAKYNIHIGGSYANKPKSIERFIKNFKGLEENVKRRITLENDDKTFTAKETLETCEQLSVPMVLDIHHHWVNNDGEEAVELWPRVKNTWSEQDIPPKIHVSSPKSEKDPRGHSDYVDPQFLLGFLRPIANKTGQIDVMIEAKKKDDALFQLMRDLKEEDGVKVINQSTIEI
ncbi:UV DNA damage repair endonuclease UvsE [Chengkuizengella axinellae]|uniref:UV DNA damage repair endonuclease UvsE n=1 Tax=Chengkuizengella axinellae TaxID=3064388 RepID=A0ABT9J043_9BACL|nr:UV DNA damage repair endonuclease UvsE [Chengkuizengella sp. 2205SS18-9]MDP5274987.1 UV DNA damage repair endonuclease UvsE [Chengkuizengella sp. 2205SS18-9]